MSLDLRGILITDGFQEVLAVPQIWRLLLAVSLRRDTCQTAQVSASKPEEAGKLMKSDTEPNSTTT